MNLSPSLFYAVPLFHTRDIDKNLSERLENGSADFHDHQLVYAMAQFKPEGYFTQSDRDAALGETSVPVCQYVAATVDEARDALAFGNDLLACGYAHGHARYADMIESLLPDLMRKLVAGYEAKRDAIGSPIGGAVIVIDRLTYTVSMRQTKPGGMIEMNFSVMPWMGERSQDEIQTTGEDLMQRITACVERGHVKGQAPA